MQEHEKIVFRLKNIREHIGISAEDLNKKMGLRHLNVEEWENGIRTPRIHSLIRWAALLGLEVVLQPLQKKIADQRPVAKVPTAKIHPTLPASTTTIIRTKKSRKLSLPGVDHG